MSRTKDPPRTEIEEILNRATYLKLPWGFMKKYEAATSIWLAAIIDKLNYLVKEKEVENKDDWFFYDKTVIMTKTGLSLGIQTRAIKELKSKGIIEVKRKLTLHGNKNFYRINWDKTDAILFNDKG
jgi:hypothetical protein